MENLWLGLIDYREALSLQSHYHQKVCQGHDGYLLGLEHPAVVTLGKRAEANLDIEKNCQIPTITIDRGGQATLHSPGQLVIYAVFPLQRRQLEVRDFVCTLQQATIQTLNELGISTFLSEQPGVFTEEGKIAFIGVRIERGISRHGIAINVTNDLELFSNIRSCGTKMARLSRVSQYVGQTSTEEIFYIWQKKFAKILSGRSVKCEPQDQNRIGLPS
jgi:lipoyl(octanoyl) transferase